MNRSPIANDIETTEMAISIITGANAGGKTTFLRSIGISQWFAQLGLPVPAQRYRTQVFSGIMTHFPKQEDKHMRFGKLADEMVRIRNDIAIIKNGGLVLLNESFATTTTREGVEIATDVISVLAETGSTVFYVTHFYELAQDINALSNLLPQGNKAENLVAQADKAARTYKIVKGDPMPWPVDENIGCI